MNAENKKPKRPLLTWAGRIVTVAVSAGLIFYCTRKIRWEDAMSSAANADYLMAWAGMIVPVIVFWITDAAYTVHAFKWFHKPVRFRDYFVIKAAAYLLAMVNITFATGGVFLWFMKMTGVSIRKQAGILIWRSAMAFFAAIVFFAVMAVGVYLFNRGESENIGLGMWSPVIAGFILLMIEAALFFNHGRGLLFKNLPLNYDGEFFEAFNRATLAHWAYGGLYTLPPILAYFLGQWLTARAFHVEVPFLVFIFWIPVVALFSSLPVGFSGFGTTTAAWAAIFGTYGSPSDIAVLTLFLPASRLIIRLVIGGIFIVPALRQINGISGSESATEKN